LAIFIKNLETVCLESYWVWLMLLYFHLLKTLEQILGSRPEEKHIKSLHEKLSFLPSFLDDSSPKITESMTHLEARTRDTIYEAEDLIELHMSKEILSDGLQKV
ncbi:Hypothetical predicted protein, partial [Olea europaea subsp. europaea]